MRPLEGITVVELAGLAPSPYCGMILADFGAEVVIVDRLSSAQTEIPNLMAWNPLDRGKKAIGLDLKNEEGRKILEKMIRKSDVLLEPYRPGVMEKLGFGPAHALEMNPGLIYARLTGWGQHGPFASRAGHDINYIALAGALSLFRRKGERPLPPCNMLGDFAGGGMLCALGILLALLERQKSGKGQVVDAAMVDGASHIAMFFYGLMANHLMTMDIGTNMLDGGAHFYQTYETRDGKYVAVGALEGKFYRRLLSGLGLDPSTIPHQYDFSAWPEMTARFSEIFKGKTRDEWMAIFEEADACVAPVLELDEVALHAHNRARGLLNNADGFQQPGPAPRLSRTPGAVGGACCRKGQHTREVLRELDYSEEEIEALFERGVAE
ncbi:MAG: carnitine dehydratase [Deltaproteobacteria bacterium HGW-Deltaproteobacteria-15]|nr:MAG: carnitine dehydratase [Deltaproteobacteria bacterium HGW-Deltaproteobacteria-15]